MTDYGARIIERLRLPGRPTTRARAAEMAELALHGFSTQQIAAHYRVSRQRVNQLEPRGREVIAAACIAILRPDELDRALR